jgi:hypothetical protein
LKPANVLLTAAGPKVIDFGIARGVSEAALTKTGMVSGSPPYMAPEQLGYGEFSTASDVFSLGAVLHYAATATGPYGHGGAQEQYARAMGIGPVMDPALPDILTDLVRRCFDTDPHRRPTTSDVVYLLEAHSGERPLAGWLPTPVLADILAQATDALNKDSAAGLTPAQPLASAPQQPSSFAPLVPPRPSGPSYSSAPPRPSAPSHHSAPPHPSAPSHQSAPSHHSAPHRSAPSYPSAPPRTNAPPNNQPQHSQPPHRPPQPPSYPSQPYGVRTGPAQPPYAPPSYPSHPASAAPYGYPYQAPPPSNGLAVAALVLSLVGFIAPCLLVVALVLGGVGLSKARRVGVGHGQALAATIVSSLLLLGWVLFLTLYLTHGQ